MPLVRASLALLAALMPGAAAYAEPIRSGNLSIQGTTQLNGSADLVGFGGFRLRAETLTGTSPAICSPCLPGETIALSAFIVPPLAGSVEYQGDRFEFNFRC
jgi:hypothetical protein